MCLPSVCCRPSGCLLVTRYLHQRHAATPVSSPLRIHAVAVERRRRIVTFAGNESAEERMLHACRLLVTMSIVGVMATDGAVAQVYPARPIRVITAEPGGGNDFAARTIGQAI